MASEKTAAYDSENIFAKMLDGKVPCNKVFENRFVIAVLDAFPVTPGHVLVIPKRKGFPSLLEMPSRDVCDITSCLPVLARAIKEATGCDGVNVLSNCGDAAGQTVMHPHFHLIPRVKNEETPMVSMGKSAKEMLAEEPAGEMKAKIGAALEKSKRAPKGAGKGAARGASDIKGSSGADGALRKAKFTVVENIRPSAKNLNLRVQCLGEVAGQVTTTALNAGAASTTTTEAAEVDKSTEKSPENGADKKDAAPGAANNNLFTVRFGDATGTLLFEFRKHQVTSDQFEKGKTYEFRNFSVIMKKGFIRGGIDKWGKIVEVEAGAEGAVTEVKEENDISATEYEMVTSKNGK